MSSETMSALVFEKKLLKLIRGFLRGRRNPKNYWEPGSPVSIKTLAIPKKVASNL